MSRPVGISAEHSALLVACEQRPALIDPIAASRQ